MLDWNSYNWSGSKVVNGVIHPNRPLNTEPVSRTLAEKLCQTLLCEFYGVQFDIDYAGIGSKGDTDYTYWVRVPKLLSASKMQELRTFVRGYIACFTSN